MSAGFKHYDLKLIIPQFQSSITDLIIELDYLRKKELGGSTHPILFFQLKGIFQLLESIGSARIEGNNTTITDFIEGKDTEEANVDEGFIEIDNIEQAMTFIDNNIDSIVINRAFTSDLHKHIVAKLSPEREGDKTPGEYRNHHISIAGANHNPPAPYQVQGYMDELFSFVNNNDASKYDLLKTAIAHHRFVWIHPFGNGNGRTVRLFTYAMLVKQGFNVNLGRIVNPTAIFCIDRDLYYKHLSEADKGTEKGILAWSEYVLKGLKFEIEKIDKLLDYDYLRKNILSKALDYINSIGSITENEHKVLRRVIDRQVIQASDLSDIFPNKLSAEVSRNIKRLRNKKLLIPEKERGRKYMISFENREYRRGIFHALDSNGFLPIKND